MSQNTFFRGRNDVVCHSVHKEWDRETTRDDCVRTCVCVCVCVCMTSCEAIYLIMTFGTSLRPTVRNCEPELSRRRCSEPETLNLSHAPRSSGGDLTLKPSDKHGGRNHLKLLLGGGFV